MSNTSQSPLRPVNVGTSTFIGTRQWTVLSSRLSITNYAPYSLNQSTHVMTWSPRLRSLVVGQPDWIVGANGE